MRWKRAMIMCAVGLGACGYPALPRVGSDGGAGNEDALDEPDAAPDASSDARLCFGTMFPICLAAPPTQDMTFDSATLLNTDTSGSCVATKSGGTGYCVLAARNISVNATLRAFGAKPLVLLAGDTISTVAPIDVGSHRGQAPEVGAGADPSACTSGTGPGVRGGGAGGSFQGLGGPGGMGANGDQGDIGGPGGQPAATTIANVIRGGCAGQDGEGEGEGKTPGFRGHGGGAVFLIAGAKIDVRASINAAGEGGEGGGGNGDGAGGGGSGGMIGFDAPMILRT